MDDTDRVLRRLARIEELRTTAAPATLLDELRALIPEAEAWAKATADTARSFPAGYATPGQLVFRLMAAGQSVGWLWLAVPGPERDRLMAWVYNIEVDPAFRGRGYGRAAMILAEGEARSRGMTSLGLNVHGQNTVARSLYDSLGYDVMALQMKKPL